MNLDEKMILLATAFLFLPYQIASVAVACVLIQALCRHKLVDAIKNQTGAIFFYSFIVLEFIVSIFHSNWTGFGNTWLFVLIGLYGAYYRRSITKNTAASLMTQVLFFFKDSFIICSLSVFILTHSGKKFLPPDNSLHRKTAADSAPYK